MTYEAWRISFQDAEQAARAAYEQAQQLGARQVALEAYMERLKLVWDDLSSHATYQTLLEIMPRVFADSPETILAQHDEQLKDHATRCTTAVCCAWLARQNDFTAVEQILIAAGMTEPDDFIGCTQEDIDEIAALELRLIRVKADEIDTGGAA